MTSTAVAAVARPLRRGFGRADEHPYQRLTADIVKLILASVLLVMSARHVGDGNATEADVRQFFASLPDGFHGFFVAVFKFGSLWALGLVVVAGLVARRWRLAAAIAIAGVLAWFFGRLLSLVVAGANHPLEGVFDGRSLPSSYPVVRLAVIAAVVLTAAPYLSRPLRRFGQIGLVLLALSALYLDLGGVNDVFGAIVLAWGIAALVHLALGSPAGRPTTAQVQAASQALGLDVVEMHVPFDQHRGRLLMNADLTDGRSVPVEVYGRDAGDTRLIAKAMRWLVFKDSGPTLTFTRLQQVEHEALCLLTARDAGVDVPEVLAVGVAGPDAAILVTSTAGDPPPDGDEPAPAISTRLSSFWQDLARLRAARIAHGALDLDHLRVADGAPVIVGFQNAAVSARDERLDQDVAQLLVLSALLVGDDAAIQLAADSVGRDALAAAYPLIQKPALTPPTRHLLRNEKGLLDRLQTAVADATGVLPGKPMELRRVSPLNLVIVAALLFALFVILGQVGSLSELWDTMKTADWPWLVLGFLLAQSTSLAFAMQTIGSVTLPIALFPAVLLSWATALTNLVAPTGVASTIMNIRFLQKNGVEIGPATSSGVVIGVSGTIAQFTLFILTGIVVGQQASFSAIGGGSGDHQLILVAIVGGAVVAGVVYLVPKLRRAVHDKIWPQVVGALKNIWTILTTPRKLFMILGGALLAQILYSLCLLACLTAYGGHLSVAQIIFVNTSSAFLASLVPVPGGMGVMEAALVSGLTAFGVPPEIATATAVTHRLFTTYLPPLWGGWATKRLVREGYL
jgi:uncharacterized membrane protein YbhN (UPF0104 family)